MPRKLTQEEFIARAVAVHGVGRYDYSQTVYLPQPTKVIIRCPEHGEFMQVANYHLLGAGCRKCYNSRQSRDKTLSQLTFLELSRKRHGDKYDYSNAVYVNGEQKVKIFCFTHGEFEQRAACHMSGKGCPLCAHTFRGHNQSTRTGAEFIRRATAVHGARYNYSQVVYRLISEKVKIICPEHGIFEQIPSNHLSGKGCYYCAGPLSQSTESFVEKATIIHDGRYDYSQVVYKAAKSKVKILCPIHGAFTQQASSHLSGCGCPTCAKEQLRKTWVEKAEGKKCLLYFLRIYSECEIFYKVGITTSSVATRYTKAGTLNGYEYEVLALHTSSKAQAVYDWEQSILETFSHLRYRPKRYFAGETECFHSADEILSIFPL